MSGETKLKIVAGLLLGVMIFMYFKLMRRQERQDQQVLSTVLPANDNTKIVIDPTQHLLQITNSKGTTRQFLPDRPSAIELRKNGDIVVTAHQWGFEHALLVGFGFSNDGLRFGSGINLFYYKRLDLGIFLSDSTKDLEKIRAGVIISYNIWHDVSAGAGLDSAGAPTLLVTERF